MKRIKKSKSPKKTKNGSRSKAKSKPKINGEPEIFVLPPNLLEKLGINLENINTTQVCPTETLGTTETDAVCDVSLTNKKDQMPDTQAIDNDPGTEEEISIMETANLMTKSVFLSPTFIPTNSNIIPGQVEISNSARIKEIGLVIPELKICNEPARNDSTHWENHSAEHDDKNLDNSDVNPKCNGVNDFNPDEAYSSDFSDSNSSPMENAIANENIPKASISIARTRKESQSKINIISEEIISTSQLKELKKLHTPLISDLIPVTIETLITANKVQDNAMPRNTFSVEKGENETFKHDNLKKNSDKESENMVNTLSSETIMIYDEKGTLLEAENFNYETSFSSQLPVHLYTGESGTQINGHHEDNNPEDWKINKSQRNSQNISKDIRTSDLHFFEKINVIRLESAFKTDLEENINYLHEFVNEITSKKFSEMSDSIQKSKNIDMFDENTSLDSFSSKPVSDKIDSSIHAESSEKNEFLNIITEAIIQNIDGITEIGENDVDIEFIDKEFNITNQPDNMNNKNVKYKQTSHNLNQVKKRIQKSIKKINYSESSYGHTNIETNSEAVTEEKINCDENIIDATKHFIETDYSEKSRCTNNTNSNKQSHAYIMLNENVNGKKSKSNSKQDTVISKICLRNANDSEKRYKNMDTKLYKNSDSDSGMIGNNLKKHINNQLKHVTNCSNETKDLLLQVKSQTSFMMDEARDFRSNTSLNQESRITNISSNYTGNYEKRDRNGHKNEQNTISKSDKIKVNSSKCSHAGTLGSSGNKILMAKANVSDEKVEEIAKYLRKFAHMPSQRNRGKNYIGKSNNQTTNGYLKSKLCVYGVEKPGGLKRNEKNKDPQTWKTYERKNTPKQPMLRESNTKDQLSNLDRLLEYNTLQNEDQMAALLWNSNTEEFCNCSDFGRLAYYDQDGFYEHIHFWELRNIKCTTNIIFSIYDEQFSVNLDNTCDKKVTESCEEETGSRICWNNIEKYNTVVVDGKNDLLSLDSLNSHTKHCMSDTVEITNSADTPISLMETTNKEDVPLNYLQLKDNATCIPEIAVVKDADMGEPDSHGSTTAKSMDVQNRAANVTLENIPDICERKSENSSLIKTTNTYDKIPTKKDRREVKGGKKRKKTVEQMPEKPVSCEERDEPSVKKTVKCGVCSNLMSEADWETHKATEHCLIAWKFGDTIDLADEVLFKNLKGVLKIKDKLKCTFCSIEFNNIIKFLSHIQNCLNQKGSTSDTSVKVTNTTNHESKLVASTSTVDENEYRCGVCQKVVGESPWIEHLKQHNYLAWKENEPSLDLNDNAMIWEHLAKIVKEFGGLTCCNCGLTRKYPKTFLQHIKTCSTKEDSNIEVKSKTVAEVKSKRVPQRKPVQCGVCGKSIEYVNWLEHIAEQHQYLAWKEGEPTLDLDDKDEIKKYLRKLSKETNGFTCSKCGKFRKNSKSFLQHLENCENSEISNKDSQDNESVETTLETSRLNQSQDPDAKATMVKCGVCHKDVTSVNWFTHIQMEHSYLAWKEGETELDINDTEQVNNHLYAITKHLGGLTCPKCNLVRKYVKAFLGHIDTCKAKNVFCDEKVSLSETDLITCAICSEKLLLKNWKEHKMENHYNLAWIVGEMPIDVKNPYVVERYIKEYKDQRKKLKCKNCGITRVSCMGFYAHIITCGKTDEETEMFKMICETCNKPYLCIYHNQHMTIHREQLYAKERKLREAEVKEKADEQIITEDLTTPGKRRAAEKARTVIENYKTDSQYTHSCPKCGFGTDSAIDIEKHVCKKANSVDLDGENSDASVKTDEGSGDESPDTEYDSNVSEDEQNTSKRWKDYVPMSAKVPRIPFIVKNPNSYLVKSGKEYCKLHLSDENLFPEWRNSVYAPVPTSKVAKYLPPLEESCKVLLSNGDWTMYSRFEAKKDKGYSLFVGACIESISWAPVGKAGDDVCENFLAVACHRGVDTPRHEVDEIVAHPGLIQIWNFGEMNTLPKFALGLCHDYGTVWAMEWCPAGTRDSPVVLEGDTPRLGLLAVACSDGSAYVFAVPYPSAMNTNVTFYKMKPVVELRLSMGSDRMKYQATSLSWSEQKGHSLVVVGYGDGTTAYYDLSGESPLLKIIEDDVPIIHPYFDERPLNCCVSDVSIYPSGDREAVAGAVAAAGPAGAAAAVRAGERPARARSHRSSAVAAFQPLWPAVLLAGVDAIISSLTNELEWWGGGRRLGATAACCGCVHTGRLAVSEPPLLRLVRTHPALTEVKKQVLGTLQMKPLGKKRKKLAQDDLATEVEPRTYEEAVKRYGLELKLDKNAPTPQMNKPRDQYPERFPLAHVASMAFCPAPAHHSKLAVATHAGVIFLCNV